MRIGLRRLYVVILPVLAVLASCVSCSAGSPRSELTVLTPWTSASERNAFQKVLDAFHDATGITVRADPTRAVEQVLQSDVQQGRPPDLAVMPNPGLLDSYAQQGMLQPLDALRDTGLKNRLLGELRKDYGQLWRDLERAGTPHPYAVVVKANVKSLVWYDPNRLGEQSPHTWSQLTALSTKIAGTGDTPWCLGVLDPPHSGYPGGDWIEDVLLHQSGPTAYRDLVNGDLAWTSTTVRKAWQAWGGLVAKPSQVYGGNLTALLTPVAAGDYPMFDDPPGCYLTHGALVTTDPTADKKPAAGTDYTFFAFPSAGAAKPAYEVSGDFLSMFRDSPQAEELVTFLAGPSAQRIWPKAHPDAAFSPNRKVAGEMSAFYTRNSKKTIAGTIDSLLMSNATLCFDASDLMPEPMATAFHRAVLEYLQSPGQLTAILKKLDRVRDGLYPHTTHPPTTTAVTACGSGQ